MSVARDDYRAAEERLAACEEAIAEARGANLQGLRYPEQLASLLIERERLQEESYRAYRRVVGEGQ